MKVKEYLATLKRVIITCRPEDTIETAATLLATNHIGAMPVREANGRIVGMFSERDIIRAFSQRGGEVGRLLVGDLMARKLVVCAPDDTMVTARKLMKQEKYAEAAALLKAAGQEAPDSVAIHAAHGMALVNAQRYEEALDVLENKALKLDVQHQPALISAGDASFNLNRLDKARNWFTLAVDNDPLDPTAHYKLGKTLLRLNETAQARKSFETAVEVFLDFPEAHFELGVMLADAGQNARAIEHYQKSVALRPDDPVARYNLGRLLLIIGKVPESVIHLKEATLLNANRGDAWINLGIALLSSGRPVEGKEALVRATQIPESAIEAHLNLGIAAEKDRDFQKARTHYQSVLQLAPGHPDATKAINRLPSDSSNKP